MGQNMGHFHPFWAILPTLNPIWAHREPKPWSGRIFSYVTQIALARAFFLGTIRHFFVVYTIFHRDNISQFPFWYSFLTKNGIINLVSSSVLITKNLDRGGRGGGKGRWSVGHIKLDTWYQQKVLGFYPRANFLSSCFCRSATLLFHVCGVPLSVGATWLMYIVFVPFHFWVN